MISIENLSKNFGDLQVLKDINLDIKKGEIYGLIGQSGSGKSTLLRCVNGLISYDKGKLTVDNVEVKSLNDLELRKFRSNIGMIFQHFSLLERLNVYENIAFPMRIWKYSDEEIDKNVRRMLELVELEDKIKSMPRELSGGQKQRVAIARALVMNPKILLSDESTSALDPKIAKSILNLLKKINEDLGITIIVVTHQMEVVRQICDRMALLNNGVITVNGKVKDVFLKNPKPLQVLLGDESKDFRSKNIRIRVLIDEEGYGSFFSDLSRETDIEYRYVSGGILEFKEDDSFLGEIEISPEDKDKIVDYLEKREIRYEVKLNER